MAAAIAGVKKRLRERTAVPDPEPAFVGIKKRLRNHEPQAAVETCPVCLEDVHPTNMLRCRATPPALVHACCESSLSS